MSPGLQPPPQMPPVQSTPTEHALPHMPQLSGSELTSVVVVPLQTSRVRLEVGPHATTTPNTQIRAKSEMLIESQRTLAASDLDEDRRFV